jgi:hypothetical protein
MDKITTGIVLLSALLVALIAYQVYHTMKWREIQAVHKELAMRHQSKWDTRLPPPEWSSPSKCFSCEKQTRPEQMYLAEPSKCYSCENQAVKTLGSQYAIREQNTKCFDC